MMENNGVPAPIASQISKKILEIISDIPESSEPISGSPLERSRGIVGNASLAAAAISGTLALPPGPAGMLTILPDLLAIWEIQRKMVVDIAAAFGKSGSLTREQMLICLFKHSAGQAVKDLIVRTGQRILVRRTSLRAIQKILGRLGIVITQRVAGRAVSRWMPIVGAIGIGAYAYYDTASVGRTAMELFQDNSLEPQSKMKKKSPKSSKPRKPKKRKI